MPMQNKSMSFDESATEVISVVEGGLELHEEYFHSKAELLRVLRDFGFADSLEETSTAA